MLKAFVLIPKILKASAAAGGRKNERTLYRLQLQLYSSKGSAILIVIVAAVSRPRSSSMGTRLWRMRRTTQRTRRSDLPSGSCCPSQGGCLGPGVAVRALTGCRVTGFDCVVCSSEHGSERGSEVHDSEGRGCRTCCRAACVSPIPGWVPARTI